MFKVKQLPYEDVKWLCEHRHEIDENPVYQRRGKIWSVKDKAFLIDSILNDYDIPKIYLADFTSSRSSLNKKQRRFAIIDGKQRLEAVTEFFDSRFALDKKFQYAADPTRELGGLTYKDLLLHHSDLARKFREYRLVIMGVFTDEAGKINDLFIRLNRSKPLVGSEIRNAMRGIVPALIRQLAKHKFFKTRIAFEKLRQQDRNAAAKLLLLEFRGQFVDTKKSQLDDFVKEFIDEGLRAEPYIGDKDLIRKLPAQSKNFHIAVQSCRKVLNVMTSVFKERDPLLRSQGPLTLYYWFIKENSPQKRVIRRFLEDFDELRRRNRKRATEQPPPADLDAELLVFDHLSRSPNDQASCARRLVILRSRFKSFLEKGPTHIRLEQLSLIEKNSGPI